MANPKPTRRFTPAQAREAGAKGNAAMRAAIAINLKDPDALADTSMRRLLATGNLIERSARDLDGRGQLEAAKVLVAIDQTVLDRTRGKPRPIPEGQALPDDYARAVREANRKAKEAEQVEHEAGEKEPSADNNA